MADGESIAEYASSDADRLSRARRILDVFARSLASVGVAGEERTAKVLYLALTSRLLPRPISVALVGARSTGKSFVVDRVLRFFPRSAYYVLPGCSDRFLVYDDEPLVHRMVVVGDAFGRGGRLSRSILAALLAEARLCYGAVVRNTAGKLETHRVDRDGPTGLIIAGSAFASEIDEEARCLCMPMTHTADQTRAVLSAIAMDRGIGMREDLRSWQDLQQSLEGGETRVFVPFAETLAKSIHTAALPSRRVFAWVHDLTAAHALLHRASREIGPHGIVATIDDYAVVHELLDEPLSDGVRVGATWSIRQTVVAVERLLAGGARSVSLAMLAGALGVDRPAASRRVKAAAAVGYLRNEETRRGKPARVVLDAPLDEVGILPAPQRVLQTFADDHATAKGSK